MKKRGEQARYYFEEGGFNCAESILLSFLPAGEEKMVRLATPFGGGVGREKNLCGILTGGVMVIGLYQGRVVGGDDAKFIAYDLARDYYRWFQENFCLTCQEILPGPFQEYSEICYGNLVAAVSYLEEHLEG